MFRRLKHWGWGYEDQQPPREQVEGIAKAVTERLGFEVDRDIERRTDRRAVGHDRTGPQLGDVAGSGHDRDLNVDGASRDYQR